MSCSTYRLIAMPDQGICHGPVCQRHLNHLNEGDTQRLLNEDYVMIGNGEGVHIRWTEWPTAGDGRQGSTVSHQIVLIIQFRETFNERAMILIAVNRWHSLSQTWKLEHNVAHARETRGKTDIDQRSIAEKHWMRTMCDNREVFADIEFRTCFDGFRIDFEHHRCLTEQRIEQITLALKGLQRMSMTNLSHGEESHLRTTDYVGVNTDQGIVCAKVIRRTDEITNTRWEEHRVRASGESKGRNATGIITNSMSIPVSALLQPHRTCWQTCPCRTRRNTIYRLDVLVDRSRIGEFDSDR